MNRAEFVARSGALVSEETFELLEQFAALVERWTAVINLVSKGSLQELWERHIVDSAQLVALAPADPGLWVDLGSGGGFPGMVVAILLRESSPASEIRLIESDARKSAFLAQAVRSLGLHAQVIVGRIEDVAPQGAKVVSARALAPVAALLPLVARHLSDDGVALLPKGRRYAEELVSAGVSDGAKPDIMISRTDSKSVVLRFRGPFHG